MPLSVLRSLSALLLAAAGTAAAQTSLPDSASQGAMVVGRTTPGATVQANGRTVRVDASGQFVFGIGRDAKGSVPVVVVLPGQDTEQSHAIRVTARDWPLQHVRGVPPRTVNPPAAVAERIRREAAKVNAARTREDPRSDWTQAFVRPVEGRISGRFGNARVYNGQPGAPHSGMDIAAAAGTPIKAPAGGVVSLAERDLYISGGTVLIDHGDGISSNFLHLSRIDVKPGDRVEQGQVIGAVGATGRASGPHLHWGMNWFDTRIDPLLVLEMAR
ncbi:MAG: M23 family metallopeptidase [Pseudoxanthomonas suwonensis]|nr:M23 family metallopeptidase [Pseudoxanthomonas suwonensis]